MGNLIVFFVSQQFYSAIWQYSRRREKSRAEHNKLWTIMILLKIWKGGHTNTITFGYHFDICAISLQVGFSKMLTPLHSRPYICRTPNAKIHSSEIRIHVKGWSYSFAIGVSRHWRILEILVQNAIHILFATLMTSVEIETLANPRLASPPCSMKQIE
jgi:hypothetical protein